MITSVSELVANYFPWSIGSYIWDTISSESVYYLYMFILGVALCAPIYHAGNVYIGMLLFSSVAFHLIQVETTGLSHDGNVISRHNRYLIAKSVLISAVGIVFFFVTFPYSPSAVLGRLSVTTGFVVMGTLMKQSVFPEKDFSRIKNLVMVLFIFTSFVFVRSTLSAPSGLLVFSGKLELLLYSTLKYALLLTGLFSYNHLLGRGPEALLGFKNLTYSKFSRRFLWGIMFSQIARILAAIIGALGLFTVSPAVGYTLLSSMNFVSWDAGSYLLIQSLAVVHVALQTVFEEIVFGPILVGMWKACGFADMKEQPDAGKGKVFNTIMLSLLMCAWFAGVHMANPIETGRDFGSVLEKFMTYFESIAFRLAYLLSGNIAISWGIHFVNNYSIGLARYAEGAMENGFIKVNVRVDTISSETMIASSAVDVMVNALTAVGVCWFADHIDRIVDGKEKDDGSKVFQV